LFQAGTNCERCELGCEFERPDGCTHACTRSCHSGPCPDCTQMFRKRCHCQGSIKYIECYKWAASKDKERNTLMSCGGQCPKQVRYSNCCNCLIGALKQYKKSTFE